MDLLSEIRRLKDDPTERDAFRKLLESHDFSVRVANDSQEAIRELAAAPADAVLLDLELPHVPGDSLAAFLRIRYPKTRIIFISGQYDMVAPERFGENTVFFRKPVDLHALLDTLAEETSASAG